MPQCPERYRVAVHELTYAGRILATSRCTACGASVRHEENDLREACLRDLEHRPLSEPARLVRGRRSTRCGSRCPCPACC